MNRTWSRSTLALLASLALPAFGLAAQCTKDSPAHAVALLELYTSEGCDSCPQADRWLGRLGSDASTLDRVVPLALHVDYWDRLGWKDRFASARFSQRQHTLASRGGSGVVYTPGVFLNLEEFRGWNSPARLQQGLKSVNAKPAGADIRIELDALSASQLAVKAQFKLKPEARAKQPQAFVALYENGLSTEVKAGENRGVTLRHDYVVREWIGPFDPAAEFKRTFALERDWKAKHLGVAAFIQDLSNAEILQAAALAVCSKG